MKWQQNVCTTLQLATWEEIATCLQAILHDGLHTSLYMVTFTGSLLGRNPTFGYPLMLIQ